MRKRFFSLLAMAAIAASAAAGAALAETIQVGNLILTVDGGFKPSALPKSKHAPISLKVSGALATDDGSRPPIVDGVTIDFDKAGTITTKGIPTCKASKVQNTPTQTALRKCRKALVGRGQTVARVDYEDQGVIPVKGPLLIFNGKKRGKNPSLVFHVFAEEPLSTAYVAEGVITKSPVRGMGKRLTIDHIPAIASGNGTLTEFTAKIPKQIKVKKGKKKKKVKFLLAKCTDRDLVAEGELELRTGDRLRVGITRPCRPKK